MKEEQREPIKKQGKEELFLLMKKRKNLEKREESISAPRSRVLDPTRVE